MIQKLKFSNAMDHDLLCSQFKARWIDSVEELEALDFRWQQLAGMAIQGNLQLDASFLIPAFRHLNDRNSRILVVEARQDNDPNGPVLCALIPLTKSRFYHLPLNCFEIWRHDQCFDATPLLRKDCAFEVLRFVFQFLKRDGASLLSMDTVSTENGFGDVLSAVVRDQDLGLFQRDQFSRAAFRPRATVDEFIAASLSKSLRKKVARLERRLKEQGDLQVEVSDQASDFSSLAAQFLELEASGWKGEQGTALACNPSTQQFFEELVARFAATNRVSFLSMKLDGRPLAMLCDLYGDGFGCAFKTSFDETFSQYSPGLLAEIRNIEYLHAAKVVNVDSCTDPNNLTINRIWKDRMKFQSVVIALDRGLPRLATSIMPLIQSAARTARKLRKK